MENREGVVDKVVRRILEIEGIEENLTLRAKVRSLEDKELNMWHKSLCSQ